MLIQNYLDNLLLNINNNIPAINKPLNGVNGLSFFFICYSTYYNISLFIISSGNSLISRKFNYFNY